MVIRRTRAKGRAEEWSFTYSGGLGRLNLKEYDEAPTVCPNSEVSMSWLLGYEGNVDTMLMRPAQLLISSDFN